MKAVFREYLKARGKAAAAGAIADIAKDTIGTTYMECGADYCEALEAMLQAFIKHIKREQRSG